jgi:hypothetical protein
MEAVSNAWHSLAIKPEKMGEREGREQKNGEENRKRTGKQTRQRRANFLPLFLLKETGAFVPHNREARTQEEKKKLKKTERLREGQTKRTGKEKQHQGFGKQA